MRLRSLNCLRTATLIHESSVAATGITRPGACRLRGPTTASERRVRRGTRCRTSSQVAGFEACVGGGRSRFLQADPVPGGSANAYDYAGQDPVNNSDLDGRMFSAGDGPQVMTIARAARMLGDADFISGHTTGRFGSRGAARQRYDSTLGARGTAFDIAPDGDIVAYNAKSNTLIKINVKTGRGTMIKDASRSYIRRLFSRSVPRDTLVEVTGRSYSTGAEVRWAGPPEMGEWHREMQ